MESSPENTRQPLLDDSERVGIEYAKQITDMGEVRAAQKETLDELKATFLRAEPGKCLNAFSAIERMAGFRLNNEGQKVLELGGEQTSWPTLLDFYSRKTILIKGKQQPNPIHRLLGTDPKEFHILYKRLLQRGEVDTLIEAAKVFHGLYRETNENQYLNNTKECYVQADILAEGKKCHLALAELALEAGNQQEAKQAYQTYYEWKYAQGDKNAFETLGEVYEKLKDQDLALKAYGLHLELLSKESETNREAAKALAQFSEKLKSKRSSYTELAKKGLMTAGKNGYMNAYITLGRWENNQNYYIEAFAVATSQDEFIQIIQALNDNALSENYLESILQTPIHGSDIDIAISRGKYVANVIHALAYLYGMTTSNIVMPSEPVKPAIKKEKFSYPPFKEKAPSNPWCRRCCAACGNCFQCICYECIGQWVIKKTFKNCSECCYWFRDKTDDCDGTYCNFCNIAKWYGEKVDHCVESCCSYECYRGCCGAICVYGSFFFTFPCIFVSTIGASIGACFHACADWGYDACWDGCWDKSPNYDHRAKEEYKWAKLEYQARLATYKEEKQKAFENHQKHIEDQEKAYQNAMEAYRAETDLCNQKLVAQKTYESTRKTIASYLKSKAEALDKAINQGHVSTGVNLDIYRQEAYQLVIEASLQ